MAIKVGDTIPDVKLKEMGEGGPKDVSVRDLTKGKKVVFFAVPGAFTPTCSMKHLPGFVDRAGELKSKGLDEIVCIAGVSCQRHGKAAQFRQNTNQFTPEFI